MFSLGEQVRTLRKRKGITQRELADSVGRSVAWVQSLERDKARLSGDDIAALARVLEGKIEVG